MILLNFIVEMDNDYKEKDVFIYYNIVNILNYKEFNFFNSKDIKC